MQRGLDADAAWTLAGSGKGWWRRAHSPQAHGAMNRAWFDAQGLQRLSERHDHYRLQRNRLGAEQARQVV
jgi:hypothetical protein